MKTTPILTGIEPERAKTQAILSFSFACPETGQQKVARCTLPWLRGMAAIQPLGQIGFWWAMMSKAEVLP